MLIPIPIRICISLVRNYMIEAYRREHFGWVQNLLCGTRLLLLMLLFIHCFSRALLLCVVCIVCDSRDGFVRKALAEATKAGA